MVLPTGGLAEGGASHLLGPGNGSPAAGTPAAIRDLLEGGAASPIPPVLPPVGHVISNVTLPGDLNVVGSSYGPSHGEIYVADTYGKNLTVVNDSTESVVGSVPLPGAPMSVTADPSNGNLYVPSPSGGSVAAVSVVSTATNSVIGQIGIPYLGTSGESVALDPTNGYLYVPCYSNGTLAVVSTRSGLFVRTLSVGTNPVGTVYDPVNGEVYVADDAGNLTVIDPATNSSLASVPIGDPNVQNAMAVDTSNGDVFVTDATYNNVSIISPSNAVLASVLTGGTGPDGVAYDPANGQVYVVNGNTATEFVTDINGTTGAAVGTISTPWAASAISFDPSNRYLYLSYDNGVPTVDDHLSVLGPPGSANHLAGVLIAPSPPKPLGTLRNETFSASAVCSSGPCGALPAINWSVGVFDQRCFSLNTSTGSAVNLSAAGFNCWGGHGYLIAFGTLDGIYNSAAVLVPIVQATSSVTISPSPAVVAAGANQTFTASTDCGGGPCYSPLVFAWTLTGSSQVGSLNSTSGPTVRLHAGPSVGWLNLTVSATTNGYTSWSAATAIEVNPSLLSISLSPLNGVVPLGGTQMFNATLHCSGGPCPAPASTSWVLSQPGLGSLRPGPGPLSESFTAQSGGGLTSGAVSILVALPGTDGSGVGAAGINISQVSSVSIAPGGLDLDTSGPAGASHGFSANLSCVVGTAPGPCPSTLTFLWSLSETTNASCLSPLQGSLGTLNTSSGPRVTLTALNVSGIDCLSVKVSEAGASWRSTVPIGLTAAPQPLTAHAAAFPLAGTDPLNVTFSSQTTGGVLPQVRTWKFGDGSTGYGAAPSHIYAIPGVYAVNFSVLDPDGDQAYSELTITVCAPGSCGKLSAAVFAFPTTGSAPLAVDFFGSASYGTSPWTFAWSFGDGTSSTLQAPVHTYTSAGTFRATLTVTDGGGATATNSTTIDVGAAVPTLQSVAVSPATASVGRNGSSSFTAVDTCSGGACPSGEVYRWTLTNGLGTLSSTSTSTVVFRAGSNLGTVGLFVNVTLNGITREGSVTISVLNQTPGPGGSGGGGTPLRLTTSELVGLLAATALVAVAAAALLVRRRRRGGHGPKSAGTAAGSAGPADRADGAGRMGPPAERASTAAATGESASPSPPTPPTPPPPPPAVTEPLAPGTSASPSPAPTGPPCASCGEGLEPQASFCPSCGAPTAERSASPTRP